MIQFCIVVERLMLGDCDDLVRIALIFNTMPQTMYFFQHFYYETNKRKVLPSCYTSIFLCIEREAEKLGHKIMDTLVDFFVCLFFFFVFLFSTTWECDR